MVEFVRTGANQPRFLRHDATPQGIALSGPTNHMRLDRPTYSPDHRMTLTDTPNQLLKVVEASGLRDADWPDIKRLQQLYQTSGRDALSKALGELGASNPVRSIQILRAFFPTQFGRLLKTPWPKKG